VILGIDFGLKNIGLAISAGQLAEPLRQFNYQVKSQALKEIVQTCQKNKINKIVVGLPDGPIEPQVKNFSYQLKKSLSLPIEFQDENLTSQDAIKKSLHMGRSKRQNLKHAIAASLILQAYIDKHQQSLVELD